MVHLADVFSQFKQEGKITHNAKGHFWLTCNIIDTYKYFKSNAIRKTSSNELKSAFRTFLNRVVHLDESRDSV